MPISETYNSDCLEAMRQMVNKSFELAIVDPPYGINNSIGRREGQAHSGHKIVKWDSEPPAAEYFDQLFRVSKNQIIWGANYFIDRFALNTPCWILWDKKYSPEVSFAQFEMAWTSFNSSCKKIELVNNKPNKIHPTQKPVALYKWLLTNYAKPNDRILDTHLGSGSSRIAAYDLGFDFTGYELDKDYFDAQEARFQRRLEQPDLFQNVVVEQQTARLF